MVWRALAIVVSLSVVAGAAATVYFAFGNASSTLTAVAERWGAPVSDDPRIEVVSVRPGMTAREIGEELERRNLIRSALIFRLLVEQSGVSHRIAAGEYELSPSMSTAEIVRVLASGQVRRRPSVTVVEGWRAEEIAARLEASKLTSRDEFLMLVREPQGIQPPAGLELGDGSLEGFLFPATYEWDERGGARALIQSMLAHFDLQVGPDLRARIAQHGMTLRQAVILASIVERETARPEERALVASVYLNRLKAGMPLQADPTVQYAVANANVDRALREGFWLPLAPTDLTLDSPFNTYARTGLPPEPICNPGLEAIQAVAQPADSDYLYFVARGDGSHAFARTAEEHAANVEKYQSS